MEKKDKQTLIIFIGLIIAILALFGFNIYRNRKIIVDRKVEYIFDGFTYNNVIDKGNELFFNSIELIKNNNLFEYEKDSNGTIKFYAIDNYNYYRKIVNFTLITNTFKNSEIDKFLELKKIVKYQNNYYIEKDLEEEKTNYVGSILEIESYNDSYVYFKSINYYCDNSKYIGLLEDAPKCKYTNNETKFTLILEDNNLKINNLEEIKSIIK